jgi:hypothetical protein
MAVVLAIWGGFAGFFGVIMLVASPSSVMGEIEAGFALLIATVAIGYAAILDQLKKNDKSASRQEDANA